MALRLLVNYVQCTVCTLITDYVNIKIKFDCFPTAWVKSGQWSTHLEGNKLGKWCTHLDRNKSEDGSKDATECRATQMKGL